MSNDEQRTGLYTLYDRVAEKFYGVVEYDNDKVAIRAMGGLKLPPGLEEGDICLYRIGARFKFEILTEGRKAEPLWSCPATVVTVQDMEGSPLRLDRRVS